MFNENFWSGKRVLITGHNGFKGSWLTFLLQSIGANVTGVSLKNDDPISLQALLNIEDLCDNYYCDILNVSELENIFCRSNPEIILNLAAQAIVSEGYSQPMETFQTNFIGSLNILETARRHASVKAVIMVTTDKVYENLDQHNAFTENDKLGGEDPYSASKAASELAIQCYRKSFLDKLDIQVVSVRAGNVIGGGDWAANRLIPDLVRSWYNNQSFQIRNPEATRPWQHVLDPLNGYLKLAEYAFNRKLKANSYNLGPKKEATPISVRNLVSLAEAVTKKVAVENTAAAPVDIKEAQYLSLNSQQAHDHYGLETMWTPQKAIEKTFDWYERFYKGADAKTLVQQNIIDFQMTGADQ